jgi:hypothetical protein
LPIKFKKSRVSKIATFRNPFECYTDCVIGAK